MENRKKRPWWAFVILFCLCGVSHLAQVYGGGPMLPPVTIYGIWYLYILPVLGAAVLAMVGIKRGRYDYLMLLVFELLLLAAIFVIKYVIPLRINAAIAGMETTVTTNHMGSSNGVKNPPS